MSKYIAAAADVDEDGTQLTFVYKSIYKMKEVRVVFCENEE